ncbi:GntR family transcriptional regulator [Pseudomonas alliivorans]|nr:GntR family transcriptional regulator [Pseudomonas alliivorans]
MNNKKTKLYEELKHSILIMDFRPDQALDELAISAQYGLSRTPVRDTFRRLAGEGYVEIRANHGARVSSMGPELHRSFLSVAPLVFTAIGRLAVQGCTLLQLKKLEAAHDRYSAASAAKQARQMILENHRFHEVLGEMAANPYLDASISRLLLDQTRLNLLTQGLTGPQAQRDGCQEWQVEVVDAIGDRDEARVTTLILRYWDRALQVRVAAGQSYFQE